MVTMLPDPNLILRDFGGMPLWTDDALFESCGVRVAFSGRAGGASAEPYASLNLGGHVGDDLAIVARNRRHLLEALGGGACALVVPTQVHGTDILRADDAYPAETQRCDVIEADAVLVDQSGLAAQLSFADCLPLVLVASSGAFAVVHAGWRGALGGIAGKALEALVQVTGCDPSVANAYIGPYIHAECFETSSDIADSFEDKYGSEVRADARHVDLASVVGVDLARAGLDTMRIADCGVCTVCHADEYYSYRASGGACGRHGAIAFRV